MTTEQFNSLHLTSVCSVLNKYNLEKTGDVGANGNGLDRNGRAYTHRFLEKPDFTTWLSGQDAANFPRY